MNEKLKRDIKSVLVARGMTQRQLAKVLEMSPAALNNVLAGNRGLLTPNATKVINALGLELTVKEKEQPQ